MALKVTLVVVPSPKYHHLLVTHLELLSENLNAIYALTKNALYNFNMTLKWATVAELAVTIFKL